MKTLGLDLGGTKIAAAVVENGKILAKTRVTTPHDGFEAVVDALERSARALLVEHPEIAAVGIGSPGPLDLTRGIIRFAPNIPNMDNAPITAALSERLGRPVVLENDANAAGYAEHKYGAARELESSVFITISTGIGGGIFMGDKVVHGRTGVAGEVGHMTLLPNGAICGCGHHGCWEALASGRAVARDASFSYGVQLSTQEVFRRAQAGEARALAVVDRAAYFTGMALANLIKLLDPDGFVIGGGMAQVGAFYLDKVQRAADAFTTGFPPVVLRPAQLGTDAGVIGAAAVAMTML
jgi:glucokinase